MKRREFLISSATAAAAGSAWGQRPDQAKLDRISVMSLCFAPLLKGTARQGNPKATLDLMDLGGMVAERYGIHRVEFQHADFPSTEAGYFEEFRSRMKKANSQMNQINLEFANLNISSPDPVIRLETIDLTKRWIDHAVALDCPRVMVNQGDLAPEVRQTAIETLKTINAYGKTKNVSVTMENRQCAVGGGCRSDQGLRDLGQSRLWKLPGQAVAGGRIGRHVSDDGGQQPCQAHPGEI